MQGRQAASMEVGVMLAEAFMAVVEMLEEEEAFMEVEVVLAGAVVSTVVEVEEAVVVSMAEAVDVNEIYLKICKEESANS